MVGAFFCFILAALVGLPFVPTLLITMVGVACIGVVIERAAYKPLRQAPRVSAIITALGVGLFLENFTLALSPYPRQIPQVLANVTWSVGDVSFSSLQVFIIAISLLLMAILDLIVRRTDDGTAMRASSGQDSGASSRRARRPCHLSDLAIGTSLGGAAGVL
jgi:branched-chain amino acid transport system permease protein